MLIIFLSFFGSFSLLVPETAMMQEYRMFTITNPTSVEHALLTENSIRTYQNVHTNDTWPVRVSAVENHTLESTYQGIATIEKLQKEQEALHTFLKKIQMFSRRFDRYALHNLQATIRKNTITNMFDILTYTTLASQRQRQLLGWRTQEFETQKLLLLGSANHAIASKQILAILEEDIARLVYKTTVERSMLSAADMMLLEQYTKVFAQIAKNT